MRPTLRDGDARIEVMRRANPDWIRARRAIRVALPIAARAGVAVGDRRSIGLLVHRVIAVEFGHIREVICYFALIGLLESAVRAPDAAGRRPYGIVYVQDLPEAGRQRQ